MHAIIQLDEQSLSINFPFPVYQIGSNVHHIQYLVDGLVPVFQQVILMLHWLEIDHVADSVHPAADHFVVVQHAQFLLAVLLLCVYQLAHSLQTELRVVLAYYADVVLDQHAT